MKKLSKLTMCILTVLTTMVHAQNLTQTIKGKVTDKVTQKALPGATVIIAGTNPLKATTTDFEGKFSFGNVILGRYNIEIRFLGYSKVIIPEVLVGSAKQVVLNVEMVELVGTIDEVVIKSGVNKSMPLNSMAAISARSFNVDETRRYAGGMDDPARLASAFAGVASGGNNQDNAIVIRGNAPKNVLWRVEGVDIPNPNHFSGGNVAGGGFTSAISSQMLANSDFYTGAFPAGYGNALGGVFDIKLRTGNTDKHEKTVQVGILGIDISAEGPLAKNSNASYLFNYRYSTLGLMAQLGLMPTDQTPAYQDLSFKFVLPTKTTGIFSLWALGAIDKMTDSAQPDSTLWETGNDLLENSWDEMFGAVGLTNKLTVGNKWLVSTSIVFSGNAKELFQQKLDKNFVLQNDINIINDNSKISLNMFANHKFSPRINTRAGFNVNNLFYNFDLSGTQNEMPGTYKKYADENGHSLHLQAYAQIKIDYSKTINFNAGIQTEYFALNNCFTIDPRLAININMWQKSSLTIGYGKHSQLEDLNIYFITQTKNGQTEYLNNDLDFSHAHHFVLGYNYSINQNMHIKVEPYYQYLYNVPGVANSSFSMINFKQDLTFRQNLENNSIGYNTGIDITIERFLQKGYYYLITASVFESKYKADDNIWRNTRYNKNFVANILLGKEFKIGKQGNNLLGLNIRGVVSGGNYNTPLNQVDTYANNIAVYDHTNAFTVKDNVSKFLNLSVTYRINKAKHSSVFAFQLNNALGEKQHGEYEYNYSKKAYERTAQVCKLPLISYKLEF